MLSFSLGRYATVFQAEIYTILGCVYEIQSWNRPEKYRSICSDSQVELKALEAVRKMSPLVRQCQKVLNDISARHVVGLFWFAGHAGVRGNEITDELARDGSVLMFVGPKPALGVSRQDTRIIRCWLDNQPWAYWRGFGGTQREASELISGPCLGVQARLLSFNRIQSRIVTGLLTGHNT